MPGIHELPREEFLRRLEVAGMTEEEYFAARANAEAIEAEPREEQTGKLGDLDSFGWSEKATSEPPATPQKP